MKASKCVQSFKKTIKNLAEPFEGSEFYPMAVPSPPEPFFKFRSAKKGSVGNIQNPAGSGLSFNGFVRNPHGFVLNLIVLARTIRVLYVSDRTFFCTAELKKGFWRRGFCHRVKFTTLKGFCQIFYRFFETLDAFGSFHFSAEPFLGVPSSSFFIFRAHPYPHAKI